MLTNFSNYFTNRAIILYFIALMLVTVLYWDHAMSYQFALFGIVAVVGFFNFASYNTKEWQFLSHKNYIRNIFGVALFLRLFYVVFSYFYYIEMTGQPFEFGVADAKGYHDTAIWLSGLHGIQEMYNVMIGSVKRGGVSDMGYPIYLAILYKIFGVGVFIPRIIKALLSAWMCVLVYKLARRNFGENVGRIAGIFSMLMPHFIYYCGLHLKETEMVFLTVAFTERTDYMLKSKSYDDVNILTSILLCVSLFFFRTVLGATALIAFFTTIVYSSSKVIGWSKRILLVVWFLAVAGFFIGGRIYKETVDLWTSVNTANYQQQNMEWRSERKGGNKFSKYAGATVFVPLIFTIPFPTMVTIEEQEIQQMMNGSNFVKNITAFFTITGVLLLIYRKKWRNHTLILSILMGYLGIIAFSGFAQSERFHMPSLPFALIIAAYGLSQMDNKKITYYNIYLCLIFVSIIGWNWFKLAGRGAI